MTNVSRRAVTGGLMAGAALWAVPSTAGAQAYPTGPVRVVVPTAAGGALDILTRMVTARLSDRWKQSVIVDNKPGGSGILGSNIVANAPPDGLTLLFTTGTHAVNPFVVKTLPYDTEAAFTPITTLADTPYAVVGSPKAGVTDGKAFFDEVRAQPGKYNVGNSENSARLVGELIRLRGKLLFENIMYKGAAPMLQDLAAGIIPAGITTPVSSISLHRSGSVKIMAVTSEKRLAALPDVPTVGELGIPGVVCSVWFAVFGPRGMAPGLAERIRDDIAQTLSDDAVIAKIRDFSAEPSGEGPAALAARVRGDLSRWQEVAQAAGIQPE